MKAWAHSGVGAGKEELNFYQFFMNVFFSQLSNMLFARLEG